METHLEQGLLPFWLSRLPDTTFGGFLTCFDKDGNPTGQMEKSLISQTRALYTLASSLRAGYRQNECEALARQGLSFLLDRMWDERYGGFFWMCDREGSVTIDKKIVYGQSFAVYALSEYTLATGDSLGFEYAERTFDLLQKHCVDKTGGGYLEMFRRSWSPAGPGKQGGDRKTFDVHMHLMEAMTTLYECGRMENHRRSLEDVIELLVKKMLHPQTKTCVPQFTTDWQPCAPIQFDTVWGWDRFPAGGQRSKAHDITSYGHNCEFSWLLLHALDVLHASREPYIHLVEKILEHTLANGIDREHGGIFVEGSHSGPAHDMEKEFWQQAEALVGLLDGCLLFGPGRFWPGYWNVHRFVFDHVIHHEVGEWWPLLTREGHPVWTHMGHAWKINYHTVRSMIQVKKRLDLLLKDLEDMPNRT